MRKLIPSIDAEGGMFKVQLNIVKLLVVPLPTEFTAVQHPAETEKEPHVYIYKKNPFDDVDMLHKK